MVLSKGLASFFCMWIPSFPSTIYWKHYPFPPLNSCGHPCQNHLTITLVSLWCHDKTPQIEWLKQQNLISHSCRTCKSSNTVLPCLDSGMNSLSGLKWAAFCCVITWQRKRGLVSLLFFYKGTKSTNHGSFFMTLFI